MHYTVTNENHNRADELVHYLTGPRLWIPQVDYPDFDVWIQRVHQQVKDCSKRAMVALEGGNVIGAIVYQSHRTLANTLEVKNITVRPDKRGRHLASFLLRNAEVEGAIEFKSTRIVVDAKKENTVIRSFLMMQRYLPVASTDLYGLGSGEDIVYGKDA